MSKAKRISGVWTGSIGNAVLLLVVVLSVALLSVVVVVVVLSVLLVLWADMNTLPNNC
jgi:hypothetical protein